MSIDRRSVSLVWWALTQSACLALASSYAARADIDRYSADVTASAMSFAF